MSNFVILDNLYKKSLESFVNPILPHLNKDEYIISKEAKDFISDKGYDSKFGARPLKRAIQKYLEDEMAEVIIQAEIGEGDEIKVNFDKEKEKIKIDFKKSGGKKEEKKEEKDKEEENKE